MGQTDPRVGQCRVAPSRPPRQYRDAVTIVALHVDNGLTAAWFADIAQ